MTDKEKLEKIRSEVIWYIHLRNEGLIIGSCGDFEKLLKFIDSIQEEPKKCMYTKDNYTDKVQKIREEVERLKRWNDNVRESTRHMTLQEEDFNRGKHSSYLEILNFIDSMQEEPESEDLEEAASRYAKEEYNSKSPATLPDRCRGCYAPLMYAFKAGSKWQKENLWKPADGNDLPIIDREVIALLDNGKVVFAHRPPEYWDGKNIVAGKVTRNYPKTYGKGGWNIPNIKYWLNVELPKEIEP